MLYHKFLSSVLKSTFAFYSASVNNHKILNINQINNNHKIYDCFKNDLFLSKFGLEKWNHEEIIIIASDKQAEITDIFTWPNCKASRIYVIYNENDFIKRETKQPWQIKYQGMYPLNNFIANKMKEQMTATDNKAFTSFIAKC